MPTAVRYSRHPTRIVASSVPALAASTSIALCGARRYIRRSTKAFSSEVDTGSRKENASKQETRASVLI
jgi:hypothetical protein